MRNRTAFALGGTVGTIVGFVAFPVISVTASVILLGNPKFIEWLTRKAEDFIYEDQPTTEENTQFFEWDSKTQDDSWQQRELEAHLKDVFPDVQFTRIEGENE